MSLNVRRVPCPECGGRGEVYEDPFTRAVGPNATRYYGVTQDVRVKALRSDQNLFDPERELPPGAVCKELTEEEARRFFERYGRRHEGPIPPDRR